jgi:hypothetical protein
VLGNQGNLFAQRGSGQRHHAAELRREEEWTCMGETGWTGHSPADEGHRRQGGGEPRGQHPGENPAPWGWAPVHLSAESKHRGSAIFCRLGQHSWGFVIVDLAGLILRAHGPALPGTADGMWPISIEASGECAFGSRLEVDFTGCDTALALGPRGKGYVIILRDPLVAPVPLGAARGGGSSRRHTG